MLRATLHQTPTFARLASAERILIAGAGGGFDILSGLPLALSLTALGKTVHLANLTFSYMGGSDAALLAPALYEVRATTEGDPRYFPEKHLARWLGDKGLRDRVFCFEKTGVAPLRNAYAHLADRLDLDAVVLVDGGTDILMHGDEVGLGTPAEDITSLMAVRSLEGVDKLVSCVGFGVDSFHGVVHADFLENTAALAKAGAYLGVHALIPGSPEVDAWLEALAFVHAETVGRESIVNSSIADAVRGEFGNHHTLERTRQSGTELFINPLMSLVWGYDLDAVADRCLYGPALSHTNTIFEVQAIIEAFRKDVNKRPRRALPM